MDQTTQIESPISVAVLRKALGSQVVLEDVSFALVSGQVTFVWGRSGTGKSVLLKLLIGLIKPDAGTIPLAGHDIIAAPAKELNEARTNVGFLFQQSALYDSMSIAENAAFPTRRNKKLSGSERNARVHQILQSVGMDQDTAKMPAYISGGMQKRVGLAQTLALEPSILIFNEPTPGLDPITAAEIAALIVKLRQTKKITSIVVTHDLQRSKTPLIAQFVKDAA